MMVEQKLMVLPTKKVGSFHWCVHGTAILYFFSPFDPLVTSEDHSYEGWHLVPEAQREDFELQSEYKLDHYSLLHTQLPTYVPTYLPIDSWQIECVATVRRRTIEQLWTVSDDSCAKQVTTTKTC